MADRSNQPPFFLCLLLFGCLLLLYALCRWINTPVRNMVGEYPPLEQGIIVNDVGLLPDEVSTNSVCRVHHENMLKVVVPINYGFLARASTYNTNFPHSRTSIPGGITSISATSTNMLSRAPAKATIWHCKKCLRERKRYEGGRHLPESYYTIHFEERGRSAEARP
jgi:hypothetical protein